MDIHLVHKYMQNRWQDAKQTLEKNMTKYITRFKIENIICGGSAPPPAMMAWYKKQFNVDFMQGWGMTGKLFQVELAGVRFLALFLCD